MSARPNFLRGFKPSRPERDFAPDEHALIAAQKEIEPREIPSGMWDVERDLPWFPWACVAMVLLGAFLPQLFDWMRS